VKLWPRVWCIVFFDSRCINATVSQTRYSSSHAAVQSVGGSSSCFLLQSPGGGRGRRSELAAVSVTAGCALLYQSRSRSPMLPCLGRRKLARVGPPCGTLCASGYRISFVSEPIAAAAAGGRCAERGGGVAGMKAFVR